MSNKPLWVWILVYLLAVVVLVLTSYFAVNWYFGRQTTLRKSVVPTPYLPKDAGALQPVYRTIAETTINFGFMDLWGG